MFVGDVRTHARAIDKRDRAVTYRMVAIIDSKFIHLILFGTVLSLPCVSS